MDLQRRLRRIGVERAPLENLATHPRALIAGRGVSTSDRASCVGGTRIAWGKRGSGDEAEGLRMTGMETSATIPMSPATTTTTTSTSPATPTTPAMPATPAIATLDEVNELLRRTLDCHWSLRRELPRLDRLAWEDARTFGFGRAQRVMTALEKFRSETVRHVKFAEVLVHPFIGQRRAHGLFDQHISDQRVVARAASDAAAIAGPELKPALDRVFSDIAKLFELERALHHVARRYEAPARR